MLSTPEEAEDREELECDYIDINFDDLTEKGAESFFGVISRDGQMRLPGPLAAPATKLVAPTERQRYSTACARHFKFKDRDIFVTI